MKLLVLGATGRLGRQVVDVALTRGHEVTALVRSPKGLQPRSGLKVVTGNVLDEGTLRDAMRGQDAVVTALGTSTPWRAMSPSVTELVAAVVRDMAENGPARLVAISGGMLFREMGFSALLRFIMRAHARDLTSMEAVVTGSPLEWTLARPPRLMDGTAAEYRAAAGTFPERASHAITFRADASFLVDALEKRAHVREMVGVAG